MKKLSVQLKELSDRLADAETRVATAEKESKEKVEATISKARADAKARDDGFKAKMMESQAAAASQWGELQESYHQKTLQIRNKIETEKEAREVKKANRRAEDAASYAAAAISFAMMAIDEAEVAVLEAVSAQVHADSLV